MTEVPTTTPPANRSWHAQTVARVREHVERAEIELQVVTDLLDSLEANTPQPIAAVTPPEFERVLERRLGMHTAEGHAHSIPDQSSAHTAAPADTAESTDLPEPAPSLTHAERRLVERITSLDSEVDREVHHEAVNQPPSQESVPNSDTEQRPGSPFRSINTSGEESSSTKRSMTVDLSKAPHPANHTRAAGQSRSSRSTEQFLVDNIAPKATARPSWLAEATLAHPDEQVAPTANSEQLETTNGSAGATSQNSTGPDYAPQTSVADPGTTTPGEALPVPLPVPEWLPTPTSATPIDLPPPSSTTAVQELTAPSSCPRAATDPDQPRATPVPDGPPQSAKATRTDDAKPNNAPGAPASASPACETERRDLSQPDRRKPIPATPSGTQTVVSEPDTPPPPATLLGVEALRESPAMSTTPPATLDSIIRAESITAASETASGDSWAKLREDLSRVGEDYLPDETNAQPANDSQDARETSRKTVETPEQSSPSDDHKTSNSASEVSTASSETPDEPSTQAVVETTAAPDKTTASAPPKHSNNAESQGTSTGPKDTPEPQQLSGSIVPQQFTPTGTETYRTANTTELVGRWQHAALSAWSESGYQGVIETVPGAKRLGIVAEAGKYAALQGRTTVFLTPRSADVHAHAAELSHLLPGLKIGKVTPEERNELSSLDIIVCTAELACQEQVTRALPGAALLIAENPTKFSADHLSPLASHRAFDWRLALNDSLDPLDTDGESTLKKHFGDVNANLTYPRCVDDGTVNPFRVALIGVPLTAEENVAYGQSCAHLDQAMQKLASLGIAETAPAIYWHYVNSLSTGAGEPEAQLAAREYLAANAARNRVLADSTSKFKTLSALAPHLGRYQQCLAFTQDHAAARRAVDLLKEANLEALGLIGSDPCAAQESRWVESVGENDILSDDIAPLNADLGIILAASQSQSHLRKRMSHLIKAAHYDHASTLVVLYAPGTVEDPLIARSVGAYVQELSLVAQSSFQGTNTNLESVQRYLNAGS